MYAPRLSLLGAYLFLYSDNRRLLTSPAGVESEYAPPANELPQDLHVHLEFEVRLTASFPHVGQEYERRFVALTLSACLRISAPYLTSLPDIKITNPIFLMYSL